MKDNIIGNQSELRVNNGNNILKQELLPSPLSQLQEQEEIIQRGLMGFAEAGTALRKIKVKKLYRDYFATYEEYCRERWEFTPQHANRLIGAANIIEEIKSEPIGSVLPQSESQARALSKSETPAIVWKETQESTGKEQPTAKEIGSLIERQNKEDLIDADIYEEITEETHDKTKQADTTSLLKDIISAPYKRGERTRRVQINVDADDDSIARLERLYERLGSSKFSIVLQALIFMEKSLESIPDVSLEKG